MEQSDPPLRFAHGGSGDVLAILMAKLDGRPWEAFAQAQLAMPRNKRGDRRGDWNRPMSRWGLYSLVRCASSLGLLSADVEKACHLAREARNRVHGGTVSREDAQAVCDALLMLLA